MNTKPIKQYTLTCADPHGTHRIAYLHWGEMDNPNVLICVHGLTRNSHDFDFLAKELEKDYRIICPDIVGRGDSDWLSHPEDYNHSVYMADIRNLINHLQVDKVDWLGTSMGGLLGMMIASDSEGPIRRLILNDVGAFLPKEALQRISSYLGGEEKRFHSLNDVEYHLRRIHATFGHLPHEHWQHLAKHSARVNKDGHFYLAYDPNIAANFREAAQDDIELWSVWEQIKCPVMLIHGIESDLLLPGTIEQMQKKHPEMQVVHCVKVGHTPALMSSEQIETVKHWLLHTNDF